MKKTTLNLKEGYEKKGKEYLFVHLKSPQMTNLSEIPLNIKNKNEKKIN
jgi:hypothetical protein